MALRGDPVDLAGDVQRIPILRSLSPRYLRLLSGLLSRREVRKGETLYREGQPCDTFTIIIQGLFNVLKTSIEGREKVVAEIRPGQHFGLAEIITGRRSNATVEATEPGVVLTLSKEDLVQTLVDNSRLCFQLMQTMAATIMDLTDQIQEVSFERVSARLARLLASLADREGTWTDSGRLIRHAYSHQELARRLGTSRETVTRMLRRFKEMKLVTTEGRKLVVVDRPGLRDVVEQGGIGSEPG